LILIKPTLLSQIALKKNNYSQMQSHQTSLIAALKTIKNSKHLFKQLVWRDIVSRYQGSALGILWSFATPLLMLGVYSLVFGMIFKSRFNASSSADEPNFALILFSGLILHGWVSECLNRSPSIIIQHVSYVKKVVFPLEILPIMVIFSSIFHLLISLGILFFGLLITQGAIPIAALWVFMLIIIYTPLLCGIAWVLAALGTYLRDIAQLMQLITTILLFLSPIFYPASALPEWLQPYLFLNPLTVAVEQWRGAIISGITPNILHLVIIFIANVAIMQFGFWLFQRLRSGFADIL
jgi:lipopolysaccharide transport system permease protein